MDNAMVIRPISDLNNQMNEIEQLAIQEKKIIALSKNSKEHLVMMSQATFRNLLGKIEMLESLLISEAEIRAGLSIPIEEARVKSDKRFKEKLDAFNSKDDEA